MVLLKVTYRVRAHHMAEFEDIFQEQIRPLVAEHGLDFMGIWRTIVGNAGEYLELWRFESSGDFEKRWKTLFEDARLQDIFKTTGPMVEGENFSLLEPVGS